MPTSLLYLYRYTAGSNNLNTHFLHFSAVDGTFSGLLLFCWNTVKSGTKKTRTDTKVRMTSVYLLNRKYVCNLICDICKNLFILQDSIYFVTYALMKLESTKELHI